MPLISGTNLQQAINNRGSGTTFCLAPGTYHVRSVIVPKSYDVLIGAPGAVLTGDGTTTSAIVGYRSTQRNITVRGLSIQRFRGDALKLGNSWTVAGNDVSYNGGIGIRGESGATVTGNHLHHNGRYGFTAMSVNHVAFSSNEVDHNNTGHNAISAGGGVDVLKASYVTFLGNNVHDNIGHGLHCDTDCIHITYRSNKVVSNSGVGILDERGFGATITDNVVTGNDSRDAGKSLCYGAQIRLNDSQNVEIAGNTVSATVSRTNGIGLYDSDRGSGPYGVYRIANDYVHDNRILLHAGGGTGLVGTAHHPSTLQNRFVRNSYWVDSTPGPYFAWGTSATMSWSAWHQRGQDMTGTIAAW